MKNKKKKIILAGDVGGSKTILAAFAGANRPATPLARAAYANREFPDLTAIVERFLEGSGMEPDGAVFAVAGPVNAGRVQVTNLPWRLDAAELGARLGGIEVRLLNDLEALARAIPLLPASDLEEIHPGLAVARGPRVVIAPGTGLGEAFLLWQGQGYRPLPSEGGHADFAPGDKLQEELLAYLRPRFGHVSCERVCSGSGIPNLYAFLKDSGRYPEPPWLAGQLANSVDPTPVIVRSGLEESSAICRAALELFVSILAGEAGNLALKVLGTGGVYLGGGIVPRIVALLRTPLFKNIFSAKGRFTALLERIPVRVIVNGDAGLLGAARLAMEPVGPAGSDHD